MTQNQKWEADVKVVDICIFRMCFNCKIIVVLVLAPSTLERWQVASHAAIWGFLKGIPVLSSNRWDFMKLEVNKKLEQYCLRVRIDEEQI